MSHSKCSLAKYPWSWYHDPWCAQLQLMLEAALPCTDNSEEKSTYVTNFQTIGYLTEKYCHIQSGGESPKPLKSRSAATLPPTFTPTSIYQTLTKNWNQHNHSMARTTSLIERGTQIYHQFKMQPRKKPKRTSILVTCQTSRTRLNHHGITALTFVRTDKQQFHPANSKWLDDRCSNQIYYFQTNNRHRIANKLFPAMKPNRRHPPYTPRSFPYSPASWPLSRCVSTATATTPKPPFILVITLPFPLPCPLSWFLIRFACF